MKTFFFILLLPVVAICSDFVTVSNLGTNSVIVSVVPGETFNLPASCSTDFLRGQTLDYFTGLSSGSEPLEKPLYLINENGIFGIGQFPESYLMEGFGYGVLLAGAMLMFWILQLLKNPVVEQ